ncbi:MAG: NADH-quinone oxidoreductase subunit N [Bacteroidetes bacterium]|nr:NADH-quinone oxidoreductase subunit N [Bacteroidota bacterium]
MKSLLIIFIGAIVVLFTGIKKPEKKSIGLAIAFLVMALALIPFDMMGKLPWNFEIKYAPINMVAFDISARAFSGVLILGTIFILGLFSGSDRKGSDLIGLVMFSLCGAILMTSFTNLIMMFLGIEALSIPLYVLAGSKKSDLRSNEAAIKYFLMGAFSTAIFLMGCAFLYGSSKGFDAFSLHDMSAFVGHNHMSPPLFTVGISLVLIGLAFKVSAFPFHFWSPDVYEGSPNRTTVFMAVIVKIAAIAAFYRFFPLIIGEAQAVTWGTILACISACTILVGNIGALRQKSVKRLLAYSGIAQAGYLLMGILIAPEKGFQALWIYSLGYVSANVIVFYLFNKVSAGGDETFAAFRGLGRNNKGAALVLCLSMLSLAGIPLTAGFAGKYLLFSSAFSDYIYLVIIALIGSAISIGYYFRIFKEAILMDGEARVQMRIVDILLLGLAVTMILGVGILPGFVIQILQF